MVIKVLKEPATVTNMISFLGLCIIFRWFDPSFGHISSPFNNKLKKEEPERFGNLNADHKSSRGITLSTPTYEAGRWGVFCNSNSPKDQRFLLDTGL